MIKSNLSWNGIYRAVLLENNKVYIPSITNIINDTGDIATKHMQTFFDPIWCAPNEKSTECELPAKCWVTFEIGDGTRPVILGFLGDSIKEAGSGGSSGSGSSSSSSGGGSSSNNGENIDIDSIISNVGSGLGKQIIEEAMKYLGTPYVWGGTSPEQGFDCSGLVQYVFNKVGISINRVAADQFKGGVSVSKSNLEPGDLVFFGSGISHVGIYIGDGNMIHSPHTGDVVKISSIEDSYYVNNYQGAKRYSK